MINRTLSICFAAFCTACGGSSGPTITPLSDAGFAGDDRNGQNAVNGITFTLQQTPQIVDDNGANTRIERQDITIAFNTEEGRPGAIVSLPNGATLFLEANQQALAEGFLDLEDLEGFAVGSLRDFATAESAVLFDFIAVAETEEVFGVLNAGWFVLGRDTDPAQISSSSGAAHFSTVVEATLRQDDFGLAYGTGSADFEVDFDAGVVSGFAEVTDDRASNATFEFAQMAIDLEPAAIFGNSFSGDVVIRSETFESTAQDAVYDGRFFGVDATSIGGSIHAELIQSETARDTFILLGFVGDRRAE